MQIDDEDKCVVFATMMLVAFAASLIWSSWGSSGDNNAAEESQRPVAQLDRLEKKLDEVHRVIVGTNR